MDICHPIEKESIRLSLVELLEWFADVCERPLLGRPEQTHQVVLNQVRSYLVAMIDLVRRDYAEIAGTVDGVVKLIDSNKENPERVASYCKSASALYRSGLVPWI